MLELPCVLMMEGCEKTLAHSPFSVRSSSRLQPFSWLPGGSSSHENHHIPKPPAAVILAVTPYAKDHETETISDPC